LAIIDNETIGQIYLNNTGIFEGNRTKADATAQCAIRSTGNLMYTYNSLNSHFNWENNEYSQEINPFSHGVGHIGHALL
jgi:hypothetical protein